MGLPGCRKGRDCGVDEAPNVGMLRNGGAGASFPAAGFQRQKVRERGGDRVGLTRAGAQQDAVLGEAPALPPQLLALLGADGAVETARRRRRPAASSAR